MRRRALLLTAMIVLLYALLGLRGALTAAPLAGGAARPARAQSAGPVSTHAALAPAPAAAPAPSPAAPAEPLAIHVERAPLIERVEIEPERPCRDQEVLVRVVPTALGRRAKLFVQHKPGNPGVLRFSQPGRHTVRVLARDWYDKIDKREVMVEVADCAAPHGLVVSAERLARGQVLLRASDTTRRWQQYHWEFGDGASAVSRAAAVVHDYALRDQSAPTSTLLVRLTARDAAGSATARVPVTFVNADFIAAVSDAPTLPVRYERFVRRNGELAELPLTVRNLLHEELSVQNVEAIAMPCTSSAAPREWTVDASAVLDDARLPSASTTTLGLHLPVPEDACRVQLWLNASSSRGPVRVPLAIELGVPDDARRITDPALVRELYRATVALGRSTVEPADLERLRAEGRI